MCSTIGFHFVVQADELHVDRYIEEISMPMSCTLDNKLKTHITKHFKTIMVGSDFDITTNTQILLVHSVVHCLVLCLGSMKPLCYATAVGRCTVRGLCTLFHSTSVAHCLGSMARMSFNVCSFWCSMPCVVKNNYGGRVAASDLCDIAKWYDSQGRHHACERLPYPCCFEATKLCPLCLPSAASRLGCHCYLHAAAVPRDSGVAHINLGFSFGQALFFLSQ